VHATSSALSALRLPFLEGEVGVPGRSKELPGGIAGTRRHALTDNANRAVNSIDHRKGQALDGLDIESSYRIRKAGAADVQDRKLAQPWWEERVPPLSRRELFGASWKGEEPLPLTGVVPQSQPINGCSFVTPPISAPKSSRVAYADISTVSWNVRALCSAAPAEIAAPKAPDRQNRLPLGHPRSSALRLPIAAFGHSAVDNAQGTGATQARLPGRVG
jgi:hypothetical protein